MHCVGHCITYLKFHRITERIVLRSLHSLEKCSAIQINFDASFERKQRQSKTLKIVKGVRVRVQKKIVKGGRR